MTSEEKSSASWKRCGVCKRELGFAAEFYECSVSTCTAGRHHPVFCSVQCWEQHVPVMRHRSAWAEQKRSPSRAEWEAAQAAEAGDAAGSEAGGARRRIVVDPRPVAPASSAPTPEDDILVVASRLKAWIRTRSGMNTSESVLEELSRIVREHTDRAIERARLDGRRTVMGRDFTAE